MTTVVRWWCSPGVGLSARGGPGRGSMTGSGTDGAVSGFWPAPLVTVVQGQGGTVDITQLILDDHHEQRRLFAILEQVGRTDTATLSAVWARLGAVLDLHAAAEEAIFYPALLQVGLAAGRRAGAEGETLDAIRDHNDIRDAVAEVAHHQVGSDGWFAAVAAANQANGDHMAEEEREGLTDFRRL